MPTSPTLLIDLAGVARLAGVQRPVASMWRTRFGSPPDPFPSPVADRRGRPLFDAIAVAQWLASTEHGNNPDAVADAAGSAAPAGFDIADAAHVAAVDALLALNAVSDEPLAQATIDQLRRRAAAVDPDDRCLLSEVSTADPGWAEWADLLADAAYSPGQAARVLERRHAATRSASGRSGPLTSDAEALLVALAGTLAVDGFTELVISGSIPPLLAADLVARMGGEVDLVLATRPEGRSIRRRLLVDGLMPPASESVSPGPRLFLARLPAPGSSTASGMLRAVDELLLGMRDRDRAIVVAPATVLTGRLAPASGLERTAALRSGRVRAIVKLPAGLLTASPREALALWVLGSEPRDVPIADRFTAVSDLTDVALTAATRADLTSDVVAAMGGVRDVRAHAFRFTRLVRSTALLAARGALVSGAAAPAVVRRSTRELPARLDAALAGLGEDAPPRAPVSVAGPKVASASVEELVDGRHLRVLPGTRLSPDEFVGSGLVVVGADDLDDPARIGDRRVAALAFAERHPSARLTSPGDVVFRTAPTARAWLDRDGSKVVAHPARVLRIDGADSGGLVPELVVADIERSSSGPGAWRRWRLRRVAPRVAGPLRQALHELAIRRENLLRRAAALEDYAELLAAGVVAGAVTLPDATAITAAATTDTIDTDTADPAPDPK